jgi:hypothetical protein
MPLCNTKVRYGACIYEVEELDLTAGGFPGLMFRGTLHIEPDEDEEDWSMSEAFALNDQSGVYTIYNDKTNVVIFEAISKSIFANKKLCAHIDEYSREQTP